MKRTSDGRIIEKRVAIDKKLLKFIINSIKEYRKITWEGFAKILNVSSQTLRHDWLIKGNTVPLSIFNKLLSMQNNLKLSDLSEEIKLKSPFWGQQIKNGEPKLKKVSLPEKDNIKFAEFYGIMLGDGCLFSNMGGIAISGDKILDYDYHYKYIKELIFSLFGVYPSFYISKKVRSLNCVLYSKLVAKFLNDLGFPKGIKYNQNLEIPSYIFNNKESLSYCIRGLMDTDGSLSAHPHVKIMIHLSITSRSLRDSVARGLDKLGIKGGVFNKGIMIYGKDKIHAFKKEIGFSNYKNNYKYDTFVKIGRVPSSREVEMFIRDKVGI